MLNFVCYAAFFPPYNNPESFCTARFLSALANAGAKVHLITQEINSQMTSDIVTELVSPEIKITRYPVITPVEERIWTRYLKRKQYDYDWLYLTPKCVPDIIRRVLAEYESPVLLTRADTPASLFPILKMRHEIPVWIPHFCDPAPLPFPDIWKDSQAGFFRKMRTKIYHRNLSKILCSADMVTVTCRNVIRYFSDLTGEDIESKFYVTNHIGSPRLKTGGFVYNIEPDCFNFVHIGNLMKERYPELILREFSAAAKEWPELRLTLFGKFDGISEEMLSVDYPWLRIIHEKLQSPRDATDLLYQSDVNLVIDAETVLPYCPFLPSKYAYAVDAARPILSVGVADSEMATLAAEYGSTYFADIMIPGKLAQTLLEIKKSQHCLRRPDKNLQNIFLAENVADSFIRKVEMFLKNQLK